MITFEQWKAHEDRYKIKIKIQFINEILTIEEAELAQGGASINRYVSKGEMLTYGTAVAAELKIKLKRTAQLDAKKLEDADWIRVYHVDDLAETPLFSGKIEEAKKTDTLYQVTALDHLAELDAGYFENLHGAQLWPTSTTKAEVFIQKIVQIQLPLLTYQSDVGVTMMDLPKLPEGILKKASLRELAIWACEVIGASLVLEGTTVRLTRQRVTTKVFEIKQLKKVEVAEANLELTGVELEGANGTVTSGPQGLPLVISDNPFAQLAGDQIWADAIAEDLPTAWRPAKLTVMSPVAGLSLFDTVAFPNRSGETFSTIVTKIDTKLDGATTIEGIGLNYKAEKMRTSSSTSARLRSAEIKLDTNIAKVTQDLEQQHEDFTQNLATERQARIDEATQIKSDLDAAEASIQQQGLRVENAESLATTARNLANTAQSDVNAVKSDITGINGQIAEIVSDTDSIALRVGSVETKATTTLGKVSTLETNITSITSRVGAVETTASTTSTKVATLETNADEITQRVWSVETKATTTLGKVSTLETNADKITQRVSSVETKATTNATNIASVTTTANAVNTVIGSFDTSGGKTIAKALTEIETTAESITSTVTQMQANATNLVNDFSVTGVQDDGLGRKWTSDSASSVYFLNYLGEKGVHGKDTKAIVFNSTAWSQYNTQVFQIDPSKAYRFSAWMQSSKPAGQSAGSDAFGLYLYDENGSVLTITPVGNANGLEGTPRASGYFAESRTFGWGWKEYVAYIVPQGFDITKLKGVGKNVSLHYIIPPNTRKGIMRFVNAYDNIQSRALVIAYPIVTEGDPDAIGTTADFQSIVEQTADRYRVKAANIDLEGLVSIVNTSTGDATRISGGGIRTGAIQAQHMTVDSAMVQKLTAGNLLADKIWTDRLSTNYLTSSFLKTRYGDVDTLKAIQGTIGGWEISPTNLRSKKVAGRGQIDLHDGSQAGWALLNVTDAGGNSTFKVMPDGSFSAMQGVIANWTVVGNTIKSESSSGFLKLNSASTGWPMIEAGKGTTTTFKVLPDGKIEATGGAIGGWEILGDKLMSGTTELRGSGTYRIVIKDTAGNNNFLVSNQGAITARAINLISPTGTSVNFSGTHTGSHSGYGSFSDGSYTGSGYLSYGTLGGSSYSNKSSNTVSIANVSSSTLSCSTLYFVTLQSTERNSSGYSYNAKLQNGAWVISNSDIRLKENIEELGDEFNDVIYSMPLIKYSYKWDVDQTPQVGVNANFISKWAPEYFAKSFVHQDKITGLYGAQYEKLVPYLIKTIQDLNQRVKELESA